MFDLTTHKPYAAALKAEQKLDDEYQAATTAAGIARQKLGAYVAENERLNVEPDPYELDELENEVKAKTREQQLARRKLDQAARERDAAHRAAVEAAVPQMADKVRSTYERIAGAAEDLQAALDELDETERAWRLAAGPHGPKRVDPSDEVRARFRDVWQARPLIGAGLDGLLVRLGRRLHVAA